MESFKEYRKRWTEKMVHPLEVSALAHDTRETAEAKSHYVELRGMLKRKAEHIERLEKEGKNTKWAKDEFNKLFEIFIFLEKFSAVNSSMVEYVSRHQNTALMHLGSDNYQLMKYVDECEMLIESQKKDIEVFSSIAMYLAKKNKAA